MSRSRAGAGQGDAARAALDLAYWLPPLATLGVIAFDDLGDAGIAVVVALSVAAFASRISSHHGTVLLSAAVAMVFVANLPGGVASAVLVLASFVVALTGIAWLFVGVTVAALWVPGYVGGVAAALSIALLLGWQSPRRSSRMEIRFRWGVAFLGAAAAFFVAEPPWAGALGVVGGAVARFAAHRPDNARLGAMAVSGAGWGAALPALALFVFAALGRWPTAAPIPTIAGAYGAILAGLLVFAAGLGLEVCARATGPWQSFALTGIGTALLLALGAAASGGMEAMRTVVTISWPLAAPIMALGIRRLAHASGVPWLAVVAVAGALSLATFALRVAS